MLNTPAELSPIYSLSDDELIVWLYREASEAELIWPGFALWSIDYLWRLS